MSDWPIKIQITEVGPRDGLQNQSKQISTETKIALINALSKTGLTTIEASAFVHPSWVPQLADAEAVFAGIERENGVTYSALVPNERGLNRALDAGVDEIAVLTAASETFSQKNTNNSIDGSIEKIQAIVEQANSNGMSVRGYISCVIACPYEGVTDLQKVRFISQRMLDMGIEVIAYGETLGVAKPDDIKRMYDALDGVVSPESSVLHLHDTQGMAIDCVAEAMKCGVIAFDASCGGLGGCPYAPGAAGNMATEDLVFFAQQIGVETGVELDALISASRIIERELGCELQSKTYRAFQDEQTPPST